MTVPSTTSRCVTSTRNLKHLASMLSWHPVFEAWKAQVDRAPNPCSAVPNGLIHQSHALARELRGNSSVKIDTEHRLRHRSRNVVSVRFNHA